MKTILKDEYYDATVQRLRNLRTYQAGLASLQTERSQIVQSLSDVPSCTPAYSERTSSTSELTQPEAYANKNLARQSDLWEINRSIDDLEGIVQCLEYALNVLTSKERDLVYLRYIEGKRWPEIESEGNYSDKQCRRICAGAVWKVRHVIFAHRNGEAGSRYILLR